MANHWALLIGINQYKALQPLMYAQPDAVGLRNFFVDELGVPVSQCTLLTDVSAAIDPHAYSPIRQEIEHQLLTLCRDQVHPGDLLWVFFSGCGLTEAGQDYWMTLDSEPTRLAETAMALSRVFEILSTAKTDQIVLAMDMNRSQGAIGHRDIGAQTLTLAKDSGITTFLSCKPEQFSHETMYVRHGLFTKALLEGLRYHGCITASQLSDYLSDRVPELCEHHCRPLQNPVMVLPAEQKFMMVLPAEGIANLSATETATAALGGGLAAVPQAESPLTRELSLSRQPITPIPAVPPNAVTADADTGPETGHSPNADSNVEAANLADRPSAAASSAADSAIVPRPAGDQADDDREDSWGGVWKWALLAAALAFLAGVFFRFQPILFNTERNDDDATSGVTETPADGADGSATGTAGDAPTTGLTEDDEGTPATPPADPIAEGETALQRARDAIAANRYGEARAWLSQVPPELQDETYQDLVAEANSEVANAAVRNQDILNSARQIIQPNSASRFNDAIEQARQIPPEDPYYEEAQADIQRWGRVILDLAEGRAASGDLTGAIAAAQLVPEDQPEIAALATQRIQAWEQQMTNQELIRRAQNSLQPGQASSYNDAIRLLEQIEPGQAGYEDAQGRTRQWSDDILAIARARAAQGDLGGAIAAAELVPENTPAYEPAQTEIQRWRSQ
ncbi:MAG: caspase domain-containing protein [Leptolyngbyaceae cyanobacterium]